MEGFMARIWTKDETIIALALYYQVPFGRIHALNPLIIKIAGKLQRTPDALEMKMLNIAYLDPTQNGKGLPNCAKSTREVWKDYHNAYDFLAERYNAFMDGELNIEQPDITYDVSITESSEHEAGTREQTVRARVGQNYFRNAVLSAYEYQCCMTGISIPQFLVASHIKPWKDSEDTKEKANPENGLCLNALHDKAFDLGFITVDKNTWHVVVSEALKNYKGVDDTTKNWIIACGGKKINPPHRSVPGKKFLEYHNDVVFGSKDYLLK